MTNDSNLTTGSDNSQITIDSEENLKFRTTSDESEVKFDNAIDNISSSLEQTHLEDSGEYHRIRIGQKQPENIRKTRSSFNTPISQRSSLSSDDLKGLKGEIFDSISNSQFDDIVSKSKLGGTAPTKPAKSGLKRSSTYFRADLSSLSRESITFDKDANLRSAIRSSYFYNFNNRYSRPNLNSSSFYDLNLAYAMDLDNKMVDPFNRNVSFLNLRMLADTNEVWKHLVKRVEPFLDVYSILMLRQTCKTLYYYKYRLRSHGTLSFRGFAGFDSKWIFDTILPLIHHVMDLPENCKLKFDFTGCILLRDIATVYLLRSNMINSSLEMRQYSKNVKELVFDFCNQITDKSLEVMLTTKLPNLERLSVTCCRNEHFTGLPFVRDLNSNNWPKFTKFRCAFSNILLEPLQAIADFIRRDVHTEEPKVIDRFLPDPKNYKRSVIDLTTLLLEDKMKEQKHEVSDVEFDIYGSWGSRRLLDKLGFGIYFTAFTNALKTNNYTMCSRLTKRLQYQLYTLSNQTNMKKNNCLYLVRNRGSELLVNCPVAVLDRANNNLGVWTLPILLVIQQQNMEMFLLLIKRGARLNVWDSMNKSPLLTSCELSLTNFVEKLLKFSLPPIPYDDLSNIPLTVAITNSNVEIVKMLLQSNFEINYKCPSIQNYKSPLYVACEHYNREIIELLLEFGADPNWKYRHRSTPTLLGYQQDSKILETFLDYGAGSSSEKRWVLVQVLACAIVKDDYETVDILVTRFPDLVEREHEIYSKPIIAVSKLNRLKMLQMLIDKKTNVNTFDSFGTTALHAACEEAHIDCIKLLIEKGAELDVQDVFGRTPLHLAVMENKPFVVSLLLENGAKQNIKEYSFGESPSMTAVRTRNENIATILLKTGVVDPSIEDIHGKNIRYYLSFYKMSKLDVYLGTPSNSTTTTNFS